MIKEETHFGLTARRIKKADNQITYAIGYRNLYNIIVLAIGAVGLLITSINTTQNWVALAIFIMGGKWVITRMQENVDILAVEEF